MRRIYQLLKKWRETRKDKKIIVRKNLEHCFYQGTFNSIMRKTLFFISFLTIYRNIDITLLRYIDNLFHIIIYSFTVIIIIFPNVEIIMLWLYNIVLDILVKKFFTK